MGLFQNMPDEICKNDFPLTLIRRSLKPMIWLQFVLLLLLNEDHILRDFLNNKNKLQNMNNSLLIVG